MATRPAFFASKDLSHIFRSEEFEFNWHPGLSLAQRKLSSKSLIDSVLRSYPDLRVLEVSRMSDSDLGVRLSAFNLTYPFGIETKDKPVENVFQSSKVFREGGPYKDLLRKTPKEAKTDPRLKDSGPLIAFSLEDQSWPVTPLTSFYDWIYLQALRSDEALSSSIMQYDVFTDIAFNPKKSFNCQARTVATFVSLQRQGLLEEVLRSKEAYFLFLERGSRVRQEEKGQLSMDL